MMKREGNMSTRDDDDGLCVDIGRSKRESRKGKAERVE
jgi:hypothetical protein